MCYIMLLQHNYKIFSSFYDNVGLFFGALKVTTITQQKNKNYITTQLVVTLKTD